MKLGETKSSLATVSSGAPQSSVLGPVLSVFISSHQPCKDRVTIIKYADDVTIILPVFKNHFDGMSSFHAEVNHFENWCQQHQIKINHAKSKIMNVNFRLASQELRRSSKEIEKSNIAIMQLFNGP